MLNVKDALLGRNGVQGRKGKIMFAIEIDDLPRIGTEITCPHCGEIHAIRYGDKILKDGTKQPSKLLAFYTCGGKSYLAGIDGKNIMSRLKKEG